MAEFQQSYPTRAAAFEKFVEAQNLPVKRAKFYEDCKRLKMVQPDKSVRLSDLLAYVQKELQVAPATGQSISDKAHAEEMAKLERREKELKIKKLEREERKDDRNWIERDAAYAREGALVTRLMGEIRFQVGRVVPAAIAACHGDGTRKPEVFRLFEEAVFASFRAIYEGGELDVTFEDEDEEE